MAAPASLVIAKLFYPETQKSLITDDYLRTIKDECVMQPLLVLTLQLDVIIACNRIGLFGC